MFQCYFKISDLDGSYWTMITEMTFYIGILILFHLKLLKYLNIIGIGLSVFVVIITSLGGDMILVNKIICWIPSLQFIPLFFAGTIFYKIYTIKSKLVENYAILIICLISQIFLFNYSGRSRFFLVRSEYAIMLIIYFVLFTLFVNGKLNFIVSKWTLFLGKISFALYLIHDLISINFIIPFLTNKLHVNFWIASFVISLPIVILLASIITYYIEIPISKSMKEKLSTTLAHKI
jgi:peptidoglycan/LPS O-acetylase OafA/YrhL